MMKKLITVLALCLFPLGAQAWEATVGAGYDHRHFSSDDQLGATSPTANLRPVSSSGLRLSGSWLWDMHKHINVGAELGLGYGWLSVPYQHSYTAKTAGKIDTSDLSTQSVILAGKFRALERGGHFLFLKPGFLVTNLASGWDSVDTDTGGILAVEIASALGDRNRLTVDVQAILSPTIRGRTEYDFSFGLVLGVQQLFISKPVVEVPQPVKVVPPPAPKPEPVVIPAAPAPVKPPAPVMPQAPEVTKIKVTLKFDSDGKILSESEPLLEKLLDSYKQSPAIIKIQHRQEASAAKKSESIKSWFLSKGVPNSDILTESVVMEKPLKIDIVPK